MRYIYDRPKLNWISSLKKKEISDKIIDQIHSDFYKLFKMNDFNTMDGILLIINPKFCSVDILLSILTATLPFCRILKKRKQFFDKTEKFLKEKYPNDYSSLLKGLDMSYSPFITF